jgi:hypothetical protein
MEYLNNNQKKIFHELSNTQIYLYCTPKCGGTSLYESLKKKYNTIHIHSQLFFEEYYKDKDIINNTFKIIDCIEESRKNYDEIFIIDVYRKPIEKNMSYFFHIIDQLIPDYENKTIEELINFFNINMYFEYKQSIDEVTDYYNINLYETEFNHEKMYLDYKFENIRFIILHFDYIDNWNTILSEIYKCDIDLLDRNIGEKKHYSDIYKDYKNKYNIPNFILEFIKKEKNFIYFNDDKMQNDYIDLWSKKQCELKISNLPGDFNEDTYKAKNPDLERMNKLELIWHYSLFGKDENREYR